MNATSNKARSVILLTALLGLVILLAAWFLLISPVLAGAAEASTNAAAQEDQNANTQVQVNKLREQYSRIDEYTQQLQALQVQIPTAPQYPELQRMFSDVAGRHGVVITALTFGSAQPFEATTSATQDAGDDGLATTDTSSPAPSPTPGTDSSTAAGPTAVQGQYGIPVSVTVVGKYDNVMAALKELQTGTDRLVLITNVTITKAAGDAPLAVPGAPDGSDTTGVFAGQTFVLTSSTPTEQAPPDSGTGSSPSPSPTN